MNTFVDVYGFAGGFTLGMVQAGFYLTSKKENPGGFGVPNCEANRRLLGGGWDADVNVPEMWRPEKARVVAGNPPCSGFSMMSEPSFRGVDSKVNACMWALVGYAARMRPLPEAVVFESVQGAFTKGYPLMNKLHKSLEVESGEKWDLYHVLHDGFAVGGCQANRRRYFFTAVRHGAQFGVAVPPVFAKPNLMDVIGDLQPLNLEWTAQTNRLPPSGYLVKQRQVRAPHVAETMTQPAYTAPGESMAWVKGTSTAYDSVDGHVDVDNPMNRKITELVNFGNWTERTKMEDVLRDHVRRYGWESLSGAFDPKFKEKMEKTDFHMGFTQPFRWAYDEPARVIHGGAMYISVHPEEARCLTHRECARVMGFPDDWKIAPLEMVKGLPLTWGKGIAVQAGRWIGQALQKSLAGDAFDERGVKVDDVDREFVIDVTSTRYGKKSMWRDVPH